MKYRTPVLIVLCGVLGTAGVIGCASMFSDAPATPEQVEQLNRWKAISNDLIGESATLQQEIVAATDPEDRAKLEEQLASTQAQLEMANAAIQNAETPGDVGWGLLEVGLTATTAFFPPAGIALIILRSLKRLSKKTVPAIFESIKTGDGPKNPEAAKIALLKDPEARALYEKWRDAQPAPAATG